MALPVIPLTVRAAVRGLNTVGRPWVNVWHFRKTSGSVDATALAALDAELFKLYVGSAYAGAGNQPIKQYWPAGCVVQDATYTPLDGSAASTLVSWTGAGADAGGHLPPECAVVLSLRTGFRGRRFRGRIYLPVGTQSQANSGLVIAAYRSGVPGNYTAFRTALTAANWEHVVASYVGAFATPVASVLIDSKFDVQRRRK